MPVTYNGIGTHYYGKKNLQKRPGACPHCGRGVELLSYDTRLWFVIAFIPIIPLGRKRIIDYCPACRRHYAADLNKWETAKQLEISGAQDKFRSNPSPEAAIAAHQQLLNFHQTAEAAAFQETMLEKYPDNAKIQAYLGIALERQGQMDKAVARFERALALRPDLPEARVGVARARIREGRLGEARNLLDFLEKPGAVQLYSLEPLEVLGLAYQKAGQHNEALEMFARLQQGLPAIAQVKGYRDMVKKSEKALGRPNTILPKQKFNWRRLLQVGGGNTGTPQVTWRSLGLVGILIALVALGFVISNEYIRRHRTVYLVNATGAPATVNIAGVGGVDHFQGMRTLVMPEGAHHAVITGAMPEEFDFSLHDDYFNRWFGKPVWVLNVGKAALLIKEDATYAASDAPPSRYTFYYGQSFQLFPSITHPFQPLPRSIEVQSGESRTLTGLELFNGDAADVFKFYLREQNVAEALKFAESWLPLHPDDTVLLQLYMTTAVRQKQTSRLDALLRSGLAKRPVLTEWHRVYQSRHENRADLPALVAEYDRLVAADPTNSTLLYLRGRIDADRAVARNFFQRSTNADPRNTYPLVALAYADIAAADWTAAKALLMRANELEPGDLRTGQLLALTRLALGEAAEVEKQMRARIAADPINYVAEINLIDSLAAQGSNEAALQSVNAFAAACRSKHGRAADAAIKLVQYQELYATANFAGLEKAAASDQSLVGRTTYKIALLEEDRLADALAASAGELDEEEKPQMSLALAIACRHLGDSAEADRWLARAVQELETGSEDYARAAAMISQDTPPTSAQVLDVAIPARLKATVLAALSQKFPQSRVEFAALARKLNVERRFPYYLVQRVTSEKL